MSSVSFSLLNLLCHMMMRFLLAFYAGQYNSVRATLEGWRTPIRAKVAAEYDDSAAEGECKIYRAPANTAMPHHGVRILCSASVHGITNPAHYARNQARSSRLKGLNEDST